MSGKKICRIMYYPALLFLLLNITGMIYLNKVYNISLIHTIIFITVQIILIGIVSAVSSRNIRSATGIGEMLELSGFDIENEYSEAEKFEYLKNTISDLTKKISVSENSSESYRAANLKMQAELEKVKKEIALQKQSAEELLCLKGKIKDLLISIKDIENNYLSYDSSVQEIAGNQTESAENLNRIIGNLIDSIEREALIASKAEEISTTMTHTVRSGGDDISKTIALISAVEQLSGQISEIIAVIDNITELTNLLAMNAAIEAAHAGDAGKGFAVVAGEIQKLSKETSKSSGKISDLVKNVSSAIIDMTSNAENASEGLKAIMDSVHRTEDIVKDITGAIKQQSEEGNRVLTASNKIIESADRINAGKNKYSQVVDMFPAIIGKIEDCSSEIGTGVENIISDLDESEGRIREIISSIN